MTPDRSARRQVPSEKAFAQAVVELAAWCGWRVYRVWNSRHSPSGWPDLVLCRPPALIVAEVKSARGRLSAAQRAWLEALGQCPGIEVYVWRPTDWETIAARLQRR